MTSGDHAHVLKPNKRNAQTKATIANSFDHDPGWVHQTQCVRSTKQMIHVCSCTHVNIRCISRSVRRHFGTTENAAWVAAASNLLTRSCRGGSCSCHVVSRNGLRTTCRTPCTTGRRHIRSYTSCVCHGCSRISVSCPRWKFIPVLFVTVSMSSGRWHAAKVRR